MPPHESTTATTEQADAGYQAALEEFACIIDALGVTVRQGQLPGDWWGAYDHDARTVILRPGLAPLQCRSTLAHELGHATYGHAGYGVEGQERQAEEWAANLLIESGRQVAYATCRSNILGLLALQLRVLPRDLATYNEVNPGALSAALADGISATTGSGWGSASPARHTLSIPGMPDTPRPTQHLRDLIDQARAGLASSDDLDAALDQLEAAIGTRPTQAG